MRMQNTHVVLRRHIPSVPAAGIWIMLRVKDAQLGFRVMVEQPSPIRHVQFLVPKIHLRVLNMPHVTITPPIHHQAPSILAGPVRQMRIRAH